VRVPAAYLLARTFGMGPAGIWTGILISAVASFLLHLGYYATGRWKRKVAVLDPAAADHV